MKDELYLLKKSKFKQKNLMKMNQTGAIPRIYGMYRPKHGDQFKRRVLYEDPIK